MNNQRILPASGGDSYRSGVKRVLQGLLILATGGGIAMGAAALAQSSGPSVEKALAERIVGHGGGVLVPATRAVLPHYHSGTRRPGK